MSVTLSIDKILPSNIFLYAQIILYSVLKLYLLVMPQTATMSCWNMVVCAEYLFSIAVVYSGLTYAIVHVELV